MRISKEHGMKWFGISLLFFIPIILFYTFHIQMKPLENSFISDARDFQVKEQNDKWRDFDPNRYESKVTGTYSFKTTLPKNHWRDPYMFLVFIPNAEVYLENELIYKYSPRYEYREHPHLIRLPDDFSNRTLMINIDFERETLHPGLFIIDSPLQIIIMNVLQSDYRLLLGIVSLLISIVGFILYVGRRQSSYLFFSLFALYIAQLCVSRSWFLFGLFTSSPFFHYIQDVILPIGAYFFLRFYKNIFETTNHFRIYRWLSRILSVMFGVLLVTALFFPTVYRNEMHVLIQNVVLPGVIVVILILTLRTYRKRRDTESFWYMAGIVTFGLFALLYFLMPFLLWVDQILPKWFQISVVYKIMFAGDRFLHGIFILLFCMTMVLKARIESIFQKAQTTAEELQQLSESLEQLVEERTKALKQTNRNLRSSMQKTAEVLAEIAVLEDRNRIAQDMHDRTGHALTAALIQIEAAKLLVTRDTDLMLTKLEAARASVTGGLESIRETVRMMKLDYEELSLVMSIQKLIQETEASIGIQIYYAPEPMPDLEPILKKTLYLAFQEGLTNGIRHGKATRFDFSLKKEEGFIYFRLANDGEPYGGEEFGFGLKTMRERVESLNGTLQLETTDSHACVLRITLPVESNEDEREGA